MRYRQGQFLNSSLLALGVAIAALACSKKEEEPTDKTTPAPSVQSKVESQLSQFPKPNRPVVDPGATGVMRSSQDLLLKAYPQILARWEEEIKLRNELVSPSPPGYVPEKKGLAIRISLSLRDSTLKRGSALWYRIEIQNVGTEVVGIDDQFLLSGGIRSPRHVQLLVTSPNGSERPIPIGYLPWEDPDPWAISDVQPDALKLPGMNDAKTDEERAIILERWKAKDRLDVRLLPGETLGSRPWRYVTFREFKQNERAGLPEDPSVPGKFRELWTSFKFDPPGTYHIKAIYRDNPTKALSEDKIRALMKRYGQTREQVMEDQEKLDGFHLGEAVSNAVSVQVLP